MTKKPLVSVIVPTKNSGEFLDACLESIADQTYKNIEIIVVDNSSTDDTKDIAKKYTKKVYNKGPERSPQRNYGVSKASGEYVLILDSDMQPAPVVVAEAVDAINANGIAGVIIPEESFGEGFWAQCKKLEMSFYVGVDWMEAARFFRKVDYEKLGGYNIELISGEDWDLSKRMAKLGKLSRTSSYIYHNEGRISLYKTLKKKAYYASKISNYVDANDDVTTASETGGVFKRFGLYFAKPAKLFRNPLVGLGMLLMKALEFGFGSFGFLKSKLIGA